MKSLSTPSSDAPQKTSFFHVIGYGSQGSAWAYSLQKRNCSFQTYLPSKSKSAKTAQRNRIPTCLIEDLPQRIREISPNSRQWILFLCPDPEIRNIYEELLRRIEKPLELVIAHGYSIYSKDLKPNANHQAHLLAPKAIGPKLKEAMELCFPKTHSLKAAILSSDQNDPAFLCLTEYLGFSTENLIPTSFEGETVADLMSEQGLLCGGIFNLLEMTMRSMQEAGIPKALIQEECLTELELVAQLIRQIGPNQAFEKISQAAQCGTVLMRKSAFNSEFEKKLKIQFESIQSGKFDDELKNQTWKIDAENLKASLKELS